MIEPMAEYLITIASIGSKTSGCKFSGSNILNGHHRNAGRRGQRTAM